MNNGFLATVSLGKHTFCVFVRIATPSVLTNIQNVFFPKELHGAVDEKVPCRSADLLWRPNLRYNEFCCYKECRYKEGSLYPV